jgi:hypothetical protein
MENIGGSRTTAGSMGKGKQSSNDFFFATPNLSYTLYIPGKYKKKINL